MILIIKIFFFLIKVTTCPKKCSVLMNDLSCDDTHSLGGIDLKIGKWKEKERIYYCSKSYPWTFLSVNCSSWNSSKSYIQIYVMNN